MATLTKQQITPAGIAPSFVAAAGGGDKHVPGDGSFIEVKNGSGSPITVTIDDPNSIAPAGAATFNPDLSVSVPATTGDRMIGPLGARFANPADGLCAITYSAVTSLTIGSFQT